MLKECHISIMRAQLLINMIMRRVSKICDFVPYTDINPQLRRQRIIRDVLIYDCKPVCSLHTEIKNDGIVTKKTVREKDLSDDIKQ